MSAKVELYLKRIFAMTIVLTLLIAVPITQYQKQKYSSEAFVISAGAAAGTLLIGAIVVASGYLLTKPEDYQKVSEKIYNSMSVAERQQIYEIANTPAYDATGNNIWTISQDIYDGVRGKLNQHFDPMKTSISLSRFTSEIYNMSDIPLSSSINFPVDDRGRSLWTVAIASSFGSLSYANIPLSYYSNKLYIHLFDSNNNYVYSFPTGTIYGSSTYYVNGIGMTYSNPNDPSTLMPYLLCTTNVVLGSSTVNATVSGSYFKEARLGYDYYPYNFISEAAASGVNVTGIMLSSSTAADLGLSIGDTAVIDVPYEYNNKRDYVTTFPLPFLKSWENIDGYADEVAKAAEAEGADTANPDVPINPPDVDFGNEDYKVPLKLFDKFPFSLPKDFYNLIKAFNAEPRAPRFSFPFWGHSFDLDLSIFDPVARVVRVFVLIGYVSGLIFITRKIIM